VIAMTRELPETTMGTTGDEVGAGGETNSKESGGAGGAESALNHPSSSAFEAWLTGYRRRLEEFVKNAGLK
jgi:hypothetical protein